MLINKENFPYRMGLSPLYFLPPPSVSVTNERLGYFPVTPPYHQPYDYVLPAMQSPPQTAPAVPAATSSSSALAAVDNGQSLYFYMNAAGKEEIASVPLSPPHTPPLLYATHSSASILTGNGTHGGSGIDAAALRPIDANANQYGLSDLWIGDSGHANGGSYFNRKDNDDGTDGDGNSENNSNNNISSVGADEHFFRPRNSVIMKVENQQVVPLLEQKGSQAVEEFMCRWENCYCVFFKLEDLASHVTQKHAVVGLAGLYYCRWENCLRQDRGFNARYKMLVHVRTHTKEKPHRCPKCGKCFSRAENLKIHLRSHSGEKPYVCPVEGCNKAYSNSSDRFKHTRTHSTDKPYVCKVPGCLKRYTDPSSLRKHVKTFKHLNLIVPAESDCNLHVHNHDLHLATTSYYSHYSNGSNIESASKMASDNSYTDDSRVSSSSSATTTTVASSPELGGSEDSNVLIDVVSDDKCDEKLIFTDYNFYRDRGPLAKWPSVRYRSRSASPPWPDTHRAMQSDEGSGEEYEYGCAIEPCDRSCPRRGYVEPVVPATVDELPTIVEDDDLCSAVRSLNGGRLAELDTAMEVDVPLDLSVHHR
ncbi:transcriptional activator GLI3 [Wyeomyia smithii]|uniref:transcriptional activator GLI3 n=1 Tax=Wyeomyia smithii TaxID=174621 RepID=UPI002467F9A9|nr:transcriptional activator GLI3 [Wyeomyia smithii]